MMLKNVSLHRTFGRNASTTINLRSNPREAAPQKNSTSVSAKNVLSDGWTRVFGAWMWWYGDCLLVLCGGTGIAARPPASRRANIAAGAGTTTGFELPQNVSKLGISIGPDLVQCPQTHKLTRPEASMRRKIHFSIRRILRVCCRSHPGHYCKATQWRLSLLQSHTSDECWLCERWRRPTSLELFSFNEVYFS